MTTRRVVPELTSVGVILSSLVLLMSVAVAQTPVGPGDHPDLSGNWDNGSGIDFVAPVHIGASICVRGCDSNPFQAADRPTYRPEVMATVNDLEARQVEEDTVLSSFAPGVPRIGPPDKIVQTATELVFLYDDYTGNFFASFRSTGDRTGRTSNPATSAMRSAGGKMTRSSSRPLILMTIPG